jgi:hypothetical protein
MYLPLILDHSQNIPSNCAYQNCLFIIAYRTWRARFTIEKQTVLISAIGSGYSEDDLKLAEDTYNDKELHRKFLAAQF